MSGDIFAGLDSTLSPSLVAFVIVSGYLILLARWISELRRCIGLCQNAVLQIRFRHIHVWVVRLDICWWVGLSAYEEAIALLKHKHEKRVQWCLFHQSSASQRARMKGATSDLYLTSTFDNQRGRWSPCARLNPWVLCESIFWLTYGKEHILQPGCLTLHNKTRQKSLWYPNNPA